MKKTRDETFIEKLPNGKLVNHDARASSRSAAPRSTTSGTTSSRNSCAASASSPSRTRRGYDTALASPVWGHDSAAARRPLYPRSMADSDCIVVMGSNMAENHPVAFRWLMKAKVEHGAKMIHVDPRFTRTSAVADIYAPIRAGSDIAFLGGLINYVINSERWNKDPFFKTYVVNYTNAATIISEDFQDTEDLDGVFSGPGIGEGRRRAPFNGFPCRRAVAERPFNGSSDAVPTARVWRVRAAEAAGRQCKARGTQAGRTRIRRRWSRRCVKPPPLAGRDAAESRCVFQIVKRHFARYTPEMVERVTGCPKETFLKVAETILANSGADRTTRSPTRSPGRSTPTASRSSAPARCCSFCSATSAGPGGGIMALRGHATIQGSTDIPTLYHSIHGYMTAPSALKKHDTLQDYLASRDAAHGLLGEHAEVHGLAISSRCTATRPPRRTSSATTGTRRSSATTRTCR